MKIPLGKILQYQSPPHRFLPPYITSLFCYGWIQPEIQSQARYNRIDPSQLPQKPVTLPSSPEISYISITSSFPTIPSHLLPPFTTPQHTTPTSIPPLPINQINQPLPPLPPAQINLQHLKRPLHIRLPHAGNMRRDDAIRGIPQRIPLRERFRVRDIERSAS